MKRYQPTFTSRVLCRLFVLSALSGSALASAQAPADEDVEISVEAAPARTPTPVSPASDAEPVAPLAQPNVAAAEIASLRAQLAALEQRLSQAEASAAAQ